MREAEDFRTESRVLAGLLDPLEDDAFRAVTQFKDWSIDDVLGHLHLFNHAAGASLQGDAAFADFMAPILARLSSGAAILQLQVDWLDGLRGRALFDAWRDGAERLADAFAQADPKARLKWVGPEMSARSSITARQMETWAHGQEIFDLLGAARDETDRLRNIAHLGVVTIPFAFANRGEAVPDPLPHVRLTAPSGAVWDWNPVQQDNRIEGSALGFCQTAAQTRAAADTDLSATGAAARRWCEIAQCFAGPPNDPPAPGSRHRVTP